MYIADTDFTGLPYGALINQTYLRRRAETIAMDKNIRFARAGTPYPEAFLKPDGAYDLPQHLPYFYR